MTEPSPQLTVTTHDGQHTLDVICDIDTDTDNLHGRDQSHRYGFDYTIDFLDDSLEDIRSKSHLCRLSREVTDD
jgi:hypothetical protein